MRLHHYLADTRRKGEVPYPNTMVLSLLPWADHDRYLDLLCFDLPAQTRNDVHLPIWAV